jgi:CheY-like chemotaxis protein
MILLSVVFYAHGMEEDTRFGSHKAEYDDTVEEPQNTWGPEAETNKEPITVETTPPKTYSTKRKGPLTILAVDDDSCLLKTEARMLESLGHVVVRKNSGAEAVAQMQVEGFHADVMFIDQNMPGMLGTEATCLILENNPDLVVIGMTTEANSPDYLKKSRKSGMATCISKPFKKVDIENALNMFVSNNAEVNHETGETATQEEP